MSKFQLKYRKPTRLCALTNMRSVRQYALHDANVRSVRQYISVKCSATACAIISIYYPSLGYIYNTPITHGPLSASEHRHISRAAARLPCYVPHHCGEARIRSCRYPMLIWWTRSSSNTRRSYAHNKANTTTQAYQPSHASRKQYIRAHRTILHSELLI